MLCIEHGPIIRRKRSSSLCSIASTFFLCCVTLLYPEGDNGRLAMRSSGEGRGCNFLLFISTILAIVENLEATSQYHK